MKERRKLFVQAAGDLVLLLVQLSQRESTSKLVIDVFGNHFRLRCQIAFDLSLMVNQRRQAREPNDQLDQITDHR